MTTDFEKIKPALAVLGIALSIVVGYNTWAQIDAANPDSSAHHGYADSGADAP